MIVEWRKLLAEGIGAFALVSIGAGAIITNEFTDGGVGLIGIALAHGMVLAVIVSATGYISGGHINPAVTFAFILTRRISFSLGVAYIGAQLLGGIIAALMLWSVFPEVTSADGTRVVGATLLNPEISPWEGMVIEMVLTFFLAFAVFGTAVHPSAPRAIAGFGIGTVLIFDILAGGPLTGASMNPARSLGPALVTSNWSDHWVYWAGPLIGGALAGLIYEHVFIRERKS